MSLACLPPLSALRLTWSVKCAGPRQRTGLRSATTTRVGSEEQPMIGRTLTDHTAPKAPRVPLRLERPGRVEDAYALGSRLGAGAFGVVSLGTCRSTGAKVAVKEIRVDRAPRLEAELSIAGELCHPHLARVFEVYRDSGRVQVVMELCTGGDLFDAIMADAVLGFEEATAATFTRDALSAVAYLHERRIAHRDVKPENLLLQSAERGARLVLADFGLARRFSPGEPMLTRVGTPYYTAPEVLRKSYNELADVWSVGVVAYACVCGCPPFAGACEREVLRRVREGVASFASQSWQAASQDAVELVAGLLTYNPDERPSAAAALEHAWVAGRRHPSTIAALGVAVAPRADLENPTRPAAEAAEARSRRGSGEEDALPSFDACAAAEEPPDWRSPDVCLAPADRKAEKRVRIRSSSGGSWTTAPSDTEGPASISEAHD